MASASFNHCSFSSWAFSSLPCSWKTWQLTFMETSILISCSDTFLWLGTCVAWLAGWWLISLFYRLSAIEVFFISGFMGVLVEQHWLVPRLIATGQWFPVIAAAPLLVPVYGVAIAPALLLSGREDSGPNRRPGSLGYLASLGVSLGSFYLGTAIWQGIFRRLIVR